MNPFRRAIWIAAALCLAGQCVLAQEASSSAPAGRPPTAGRVKAGGEKRRRVPPPPQLNAVADRVAKFEDAALKVKTQVLLADLLWLRTTDEALARQLFQSALDSLKLAQSSTRDAGASLRPEQVRSLQSLLLQKLAGHDPEWAKRVADAGDTAPAPAPGEVLKENIAAARELVRKGRYAEAAERVEGWASGPSPGIPALMNLLSLLMDLRENNLVTANNLFLKTIEQMGSRPTVDPNELLIIGNYLFKGRNTPLNAPDSQVFIGPIRVGNVLVKADISLDRSQLTPTVARAYIHFAADALSRPPADPEEVRLKAAAAQLLIPKAQRFAANLVPGLSAIAGGGGFTQTGADPVAPTTVKREGLDAVLRRAEQMADAGAHDVYVLRAARDFYIENDLEAVGALARSLKDTELRGRLLDLLEMRRGGGGLEKGDLSSAEQAAGKLTSAFHRSALRLGIARAYAKRGDAQSAGALINSVFKDAADNAGLPHAYLLLNAVEMLAQADPQSAARRLEEVMKVFNDADASKSQRPARSLGEVFEAGGSQVIFPLRVAGVGAGEFYPAFKSLAPADPQDVTDAVLKLKDETLLSEAVLELAKALLN